MKAVQPLARRRWAARPTRKDAARHEGHRRRAAVPLARQFVCGEERSRFAPGMVLFVPAGTTHRFEDFSADFATWVVFWGPQGGER